MNEKITIKDILDKEQQYLMGVSNIFISFILFTAVVIMICMELRIAGSALDSIRYAILLAIIVLLVGLSITDLFCAFRNYRCLIQMRQLQTEIEAAQKAEGNPKAEIEAAPEPAGYPKAEIEAAPESAGNSKADKQDLFQDKSASLIREWISRENTRIQIKRLYRILCPVACCVSLIVTSSAGIGRKTKNPSVTNTVNMYPAYDKMKFNSAEFHRAVSDPDRKYVDTPEQVSAWEWMRGRTIPAQVLYEDDQFRIEITDVWIYRTEISIRTVFANHSPHVVTACAMKNSVFVNDQSSHKDVYFGTDVGPDKTVQKSICISNSDVPWYDLFLEKLEFRIEIRDKNSSYSDPNLVETDPIVLRTERAGERKAADEPAKPEAAVEQAETEAETEAANEQAETERGTEKEPEPAGKQEAADAVYELRMDPEMKVLFEDQYVRVIRTGIFEDLFLNDGRPTIWSDTYWELLVENRTSGKIGIDQVVYCVNGNWSRQTDDNTTEDDFTYTVPAGRREEVRIRLYGIQNWTEETGASKGNGKAKNGDQKASVMETVQNLRWPLDQIQNSEIAFNLQYKDSSGNMHDIRLEDSFESLCEKMTEEMEKES